MTDKIDELEEKIEAFKKTQILEEDSTEVENDRQTGMRAGSEFMAYIVSGILSGFLIGHFFGGMAFWIILMLFAGFGMGIFRASQIMK